jgi:hypothetical protein
MIESSPPACRLAIEPTALHYKMFCVKEILIVDIISPHAFSTSQLTFSTKLSTVILAPFEHHWVDMQSDSYR